MFTKNQIKRLQNEFACLKGTESCFNLNTREKLNKILKKRSKIELAQLYNADIPVLSTSAYSTLVLELGMTFGQADNLVKTIKTDMVAQ